MGVNRNLNGKKVSFIDLPKKMETLTEKESEGGKDHTNKEKSRVG